MQLATSAQLFSKICLANGLPAPKPEHVFCKGRLWRIDYYFERSGVKVALEVEGGVYSGGRHTRPKGFLGDIEKYNMLSLMGIWLIRTTPKDLISVATLDLVKNVLNNNQP